MACHGVCTKRCYESLDCGPGPEWSCSRGFAGDDDFCSCEWSGQEECDGRDNDCNGRVDDFARCPGAGEACVAGACLCSGAALCGGQCAEPLLDVESCGGCGQACGATGAHEVPACALGVCSVHCEDGWSSCDGDPANGCETPGVCTPEMIAELDNAPVHLDELAARIAVDSSRVYWSESGDPGAGVPGRVVAWHKSGGPPVVLADGLPFVAALDAVNGMPHWAVVLSAPSLGGGGGPGHPGEGAVYRWREGAPQLLAAREGAPRDLVVGQGRVLWSTDVVPGEWGSAPGRLYEWTGGVREIGVVGQLTLGLSLWEDYVYAAPAGFVMRRRIDCSSEGGTQLLAAGGYPGDSAVDASGAYFLARDNQKLHKVFRTDHALVERAVYAQGLLSPALAMDATALYVGLSSDLVAFSKSTGARHTLAKDTTVFAVAADATHVYWIGAVPGAAHAAVWRVPK